MFEPYERPARLNERSLLDADASVRCGHKLVQGERRLYRAYQAMCRGIVGRIDALRRGTLERVRWMEGF